MHQNEKFLCTKALSREVGMSSSFFEKMRVRRDGPPWHKIGRRVVYRKDDVERWLDECRVKGRE